MWPLVVGIKSNVKSLIRESLSFELWGVVVWIASGNCPIIKDVRKSRDH